MSAALRIVVAAAESSRERWIAALSAALPEARFEWWSPRCEPAELAVVWKPPAEFFAQQPRLRAVFNLGAGVDALLALPDLPADLPIYRLQDAGMAEPMARYALAALLRHLHHFDAFERAQAATRWAPLPPRDPAECVVGVLGLGAIGAVIARTLVSAGFRVRGYARSAHTLAGVDCHAGRAGWAPFLDGLDALVSALPATAQSRDLLDHAALARLATGALLVNLGRGQHVVDRDLIALLDAGQLGGAVLDVFREEPLPPEHPFWHHPKVRVTPHVAGVTRMAEAAEQVAAQVRAVLAERPAPGQVDRSRGY
ncbi:MAG: 2-hydroxyacid dehydrogenase [Pseudomonadota bacterium]